VDSNMAPVLWWFQELLLGCIMRRLCAWWEFSLMMVFASRIGWWVSEWACCLVPHKGSFVLARGSHVQVCLAFSPVMFLDFVAWRIKHNTYSELICQILLMEGNHSPFYF
jgi:hypothetical protein